MDKGPKRTFLLPLVWARDTHKYWPQIGFWGGGVVGVFGRGGVPRKVYIYDDTSARVSSDHWHALARKTSYQ
jgi:hypothetical protein